MKAILELNSFLIKKLDYETYTKECQPLLKKVVQEHDNLMELLRDCKKKVHK